MKDIHTTETAIRCLLALRGFSRDERFYEDDGQTYKPKPWVVDDEINMELVGYAADILGVTEHELLEMNGAGIDKWHKKYLLVKYWENMRRSSNESYLKDANPEERLLSAVFSFETGDLYVTWYDLKQLEERTRVLLEAKGMMHRDESIENFHAHTVYICHCNRITELLDSFFEMVERGKELFFKALQQELTEDEICEYNLIVSYTGIRDKFYNLHGLYYRYLKLFRSIYLAEGKTDFFDYVELWKDSLFQPWRFAEIIEDQRRMEKYLSYVPGARMPMWIFAMEGLRFECSFTWSDAPIYREEENEGFMQEHTAIWGKINEEYGGKVPTVVYVQKTVHELGEDKPYFEKLAAIAGPVEKWGTTVQEQGDRGGEIKKMLARVKAIKESVRS